MAERKVLEGLLEELQVEILKGMNEDLNDPEKRSPQLYNAIIKELERNGINIMVKAGDDAEQVLNDLLTKTKDQFEEDYVN